MMRILSNWLIVALALPSFFALSGCGSKEHKNIVEAMCEYVPDHGLRDDAEWHLTPSYFNAYSEAWDAPRPNYIGDEEFLFYFVQGNDPSDLKFKVKSVKVKGDSLIAKVTIHHVMDGVEMDWSGEDSKEVHTVRLVKDKESMLGTYLLDDFDNTKQECIDFIKRIRKEYKSGKFEKSLREEGATAREINSYRRELRAFYAKYGKEYGEGKGQETTAGSRDQSQSQSQRQSRSSDVVEPYDLSFTSAMDVDAYLRGRKFVDSANGMTMTFTGSTEMVINGTVLTGAMQIMDFNSSRAVLRGVSPFDGNYIRLRVDSESGTITNIDNPSEVFILSR